MISHFEKERYLQHATQVAPAPPAFVIAAVKVNSEPGVTDLWEEMTSLKAIREARVLADSFAQARGRPRAAGGERRIMPVASDRPRRHAFRACSLPGLCYSQLNDTGFVLPRVTSWFVFLITRGKSTRSCILIYMYKTPSLLNACLLITPLACNI